ncbi:Gfo/Idh/MocA family protein [Pseudosulfitobacter koreensis]|uniref:Gfo/Idh/MocA family oxidoreductase n=1 Tax=Pseudosulfitobacter koreensis TaxID=2968472 RepID=A0ABT1YX11_9RHOB|nr:Gfo/Idh/MocA family oxidoreductase [Pseudosulfitobacter koreense]MCR8825423.1 Gfo/Idh/MocA family oxidoreductase [Pseudosulfitobacter koreense]
MSLDAAAIARPRLGFLGLGWIGRHRMQAVAETGLVEIAALADPVADCLAEAGALAPDAAQGSDMETLLAEDCDGIVIATPSALHARQTIRALESGAAVFCQKPLGRDANEATQTVAAAQKADRLLGLDLCYRKTAAMQAIRDVVRRGDIGDVFAADLVFHNAYGPDKPWFYDAALAGGGCVMDLGVHLVDLALWMLDFPVVKDMSAQLFAEGKPLSTRDQVEDYATVTLQLDSGAAVRIACSWNLSAGQDAVIGADFHGTRGGVCMRNLGGSFFDFEACHHTGTTSRLLCAPPDNWGGRAIEEWAGQLAQGACFDPRAFHFIQLSETIDRIYAGSLQQRS